MEVTLYRGSEEFAAELAVDPDTGEIGGEVSLDVLVQRNPIGTVAFILGTEARSAMFDARIKELTAAKRAMLNNAARAQESLKAVMQATGVTEIKSNDGTFSANLQRERDASVEVFDAAMIPADYMTEPVAPPPAPDKRLIAAAIKDGFDVPGAKIVKRDRLVLK